MESIDNDLQRKEDLDNRNDKYLFKFQSEVFNDVKELNEIARDVQKMTCEYENKLSELKEIAKNYGDYCLDFSDDLVDMIIEL